MTAGRDERPGLDDLGPTALLDALAAEDLARRIADRNILRIVHQWAVLHPATSESGTATWGGESMLLVDESLGGDGCPGVAAFTGEPLALTLEISPASANRLLADTLDLHHRLPHTWRRVQALEVPAWKARRFATATHSLPRDAAGELDEQLAPKLHRLGPRAIDNAAALAIARLRPAEQLSKEQAATAGWDVTLFTPEHLHHTGTSDLHITGDTLALTALYRRVCNDAARAAREGDHRARGVRKAEAFTRLYAYGPHQAPGGFETSPSGSSSTTGQAATTLYVHADLADLSDDLVAIGGVERLGPVTTTKIRDWVGHGKARIQPVIWMNTGDDAEPTVDTHDPPDRIRETVILRDRHCIFPGCQVDARSCDLDHTTPYDPTGPPGQTSPSKLAAVCRRHHRAKTAGLWRHLRLPTGGYQWSGPVGLTAHSPSQHG